MIRNIGQSAAVAIGAYILASHTDPATAAVAQEGISSAFIFVFIFAALSVAVALMLRRAPARWIPETPAERNIRRGTVARPEDVLPAAN
jgi:hypothetical protein